MRLLRPLFAVAFLLFALVFANYRTCPGQNTSRAHFDAIIVLGFPANADGTPAPEQRERTLEAVREYRAGVAPRLIMTGGAPHNQFTEAHSMALLAAGEGVPVVDIFEEPQAQDTIQNIFYSAQILHAHGWHSAEVVSSPSHLPRAGLILSSLDRLQPALALDWRTHPAPWPPEYGLARKLFHYSAEAGYCLKLRFFGFPLSRFLPAPGAVSSLARQL